MPSIIGPLADGYKLARAIEPRIQLVAIEAENVGAKAPATGELSRAMPAKDRRDGQAKQVGNLTGGEEAVAHDVTTVALKEMARRPRFPDAPSTGCR
jgi:hypothetical protein